MSLINLTRLSAIIQRRFNIRESRLIDCRRENRERVDVKDRNVGETWKGATIFATVKATLLVFYYEHAENFQTRKIHRARIQAECHNSEI